MTTKLTAEQSIELQKESYLAALDAVTDAIINLEDYIPIPNTLSAALSKIVSLKYYGELEIEVGDKVWDNHNKQYDEITQIGAVNFWLKDSGMIGRKFCIQTGF